MQTLVDVDDQETVPFYWKVSSEQGGDYLQFYVDGVLKDQISGEVDWRRPWPAWAETHRYRYGC